MPSPPPPQYNLQADCFPFPKIHAGWSATIYYPETTLKVSLYGETNNSLCLKRVLPFLKLTNAHVYKLQKCSGAKSHWPGALNNVSSKSQVLKKDVWSYLQLCS